MKRIFSIAIAVLLGTLTSFAEQIKVTDIALVAGGSTTVEIELENVHTDLVAVQMDLTLPEGIGIDKEGCTLSSRISDEEQVLAIGRQSANIYRLTSTSFSLVPISGTSGVLLTLKLTSTTNFVNGQATLTNILFSTASSQEVAASDVSFIITPDLNEPYAVLSDNNTVLTFYYNDQMESRGGLNVYERQWNSHSGDIITVVFDESFANCTTLTNTSSWFKGCSKLENIMGIENLRTDNVWDMGNMFNGCSSLTSLDVSGFKTDKVWDMNNMFNGCSSLTNLDVSGFKTDNVTNMNGVFCNCFSLTNLDVSGFKTDNVTDMSGVFYGCTNLISLDLSSFNTANVTKMYCMFSGCSSLTSLGLSGFKTDNVRDMGNMFRGCSGLTNLDVSGLKTDNVTNMGGMFNGCSGLTNLDLSGLKTDNVTYMGDMFNGCSSLTNLDLSNFKTDNVTYMGGMFSGCSSLTNRDVSGFKTDNVSYMGGMFDGCSGWTNLDVSGFKTDNVWDMGNMFSGCSSLTNLDLSGFKTDNVTNMKDMFYYCQNLKTIYVKEGWNTACVRNSKYMFYGCLKLVGGSGTTYDSNHTSADYAHIDGGVTNPGYLTYKDTHKTIIYMVDGEEYKSYRIEIGEEITPEPKPTKDGYVFIGWDDIPATMPDYDVVVTGAFYPYGDVNTDNDIDVLDVVDIARYVVEIPSESFVKQLADVNKDGDVNLGDAVTLVNEIAGEQNFVKAESTPRDICNNDVLSLTEWNGSLSLNLQNERNYTAFQFDLYVPEGTDDTKMSLNTKRKQGHQLLYNKVKEGHYRVVALSTSNNEFNGKEGELLIIALNGLYDHEVSIRNIHFFDVKSNDYLFDDINGSTTGLKNIEHSTLNIEQPIYNASGQRLNKMQKGINIVGAKKMIVK